jgi:hypothetical protein
LNSAALPTDRINDSHWNDVRRIYRRVCVLRATGRPAEALDLEIDEFAKALASARAASGGDEETEAAVLAQENERVTNAAVLAELVAPLLAERLHAQMPAPAVSASVTPARKKSSSPAPAKTPPLTPPSIADLLDGMLAQSPALTAAGAHP